MNMSGSRGERHRIPGLIPGKLHRKGQNHTGSPLPRLQLYTFRGGHIELHTCPDVECLIKFHASGELLWLNVEGLNDGGLLERIAKTFGLHPLTMEDVQMHTHRAKAERYDNSLFVVMRALSPAGGGTTEQFSLFLGQNFLITLQAHAGSVVAEIVQRLSRRRRDTLITADELAYETLDTLLDEYFPAFEVFGERLERIEDDLIDGRIHNTLDNIRMIKRELLGMRKSLWPMREVFNTLLHDENELIGEHVRVYLRDCNDHVFHLMDLAETYREITTEISDIYISAVSARLNETMKVLTIIATIFMPLSFIASLYGMNFDTSSPFNMPELHWRFGYLFALGMMLVTALLMAVFFWRRGWIGRGNKKPALLRDDDSQ